MMRNSIVVLILATPTVFADASPSDMDDLFRGGDGIVVDHQPTVTGGPSSDTLYQGGLSWQRLADNVQLSQAATIRRISWWGFYHEDNPPTTETMRIRFYGARASDGLPDEASVFFEEHVQNHSRSWTGNIIPVYIGPREYFFQADLATPFTMLANTPYWLEIVQIGDFDTHYRWEVSAAEFTDFAFKNVNRPNWDYANFGGIDLAFQLSTIPEPSTLVLFVSGALMLHASTRRRMAR